MDSAMVKGLLGAPVLADLRSRAQVAINAHAAQAAEAASYTGLNPTADYPRLVILSGHYNVQLGVLGALRFDQVPPPLSFSSLSRLPFLSLFLPLPQAPPLPQSQTRARRAGR